MQITSSVAWVSALIGLKDRFPQSLSHSSSRIRSSTGGPHPPGGEGFGQFLHPLSVFAGRLAEREFVAVNVADHAGLDDLGRGIDDAANGTLRPKAAPLRPARIDAFHDASFEGAPMVVEIPVRNAVHRRNDGGAGAKQRLHLPDGRAELVRLQADDHVVLRPELRRIAGADGMHPDLLLALEQAQPVRPHCREMRAACNKADLDARTGELSPDIAADRAGAEDANFHSVSLPALSGALPR